MRKKILILMLFTTSILASCGEPKDLHFSGKSDHWSVQYEANVYEKDSESTKYTIRYIGDKPVPKEINYKIDRTLGSKSGNEPLDQNGVIEHSGDLCSGCAVTQENEEMQATIKWDGKSESISLKKE
jgi:hypothetical protein